MGLFTLLPLIGLSLFLARRLRVGHATALLHAVAAMILTLYLGGLAGVLWWTALGIHAAGVSLLGSELLRRHRLGVPRQLPVTYGLLIGFSLYFWLIHGDSQYLYYDEFSHWGVFIKEMLALDGFWQADTNALHPRYPPGPALWQYLFNVFLEPSEGMAYLGQFVLLITPLLVLWSALNWRQVPWMLAILALCLLALTDFGHGINSLYVDHVLGAWFAGALLCFARERHDSPRQWLPYAASLAAMALIKGPALAFALAAAAIMAAMLLRREWISSGKFRLGTFRAAKALLLLGVPAALAVQIWTWNRDHAGAGRDLQPLAGIVSGLDGTTQAGDAGEGAEVTRRFIEVFLHQQLSKDDVSRQYNAFSYPIRQLFTDRFRLTTFSLFLIFITWWLLLGRFVFAGESRWSWGILSTGLLITAIGYVCSLYLTYRFAAGERALLLSSYIRYVHSVALPMLLLSFAPLLPAFSDSDAGRHWRLGGRRLVPGATLVSLGLIGLYVFETPYLRPLVEPNPPHELRQQLEPLTAAVRQKIGEASLWVYFPQDQPNGFIGELLQYLLAPTPARIERSESFFQRGQGEIYSAWQDVEYVWIPAGPRQADAATLAHLVSKPSESAIFRLRSDASGSMSLEPITLGDGS